MKRTSLPVEATLPKGVKDFLPIKAAKIEYLRQTLQEVFSNWGFRPVIAPTLEFLHVIERGLGQSLREKSFRFDDRHSGQLVAFSPDITPQVARIVATRMRDMPLPLRLSYSGRVLRHEAQQQGKDREIFQAGVELYGLAGPEADAEMIAMAIRCLQALGVKEFTIDIGQVEFFRGVMEDADLDPVQRRAIEEAIGHKDTSGLRRSLEATGLSEENKARILSLPRLFGGREVLDKAADVAGNERTRNALDNLRQVLEFLEVYGVEEYVTFDLGELHGLDYHSGIAFQAYLSGVGQAVCSGGRYDGLPEIYGYPVPATGFAFNLLNLLFALERELDGVADRCTDVLIIQPGQDKKVAQQIARALRQNGMSAARDMIVRDIEASIDYARKMNYRFVLEIGPDGSSASLLCLQDDSRREVRIEDVLSGSLTL